MYKIRCTKCGEIIGSDIFKYAYFLRPPSCEKCRDEVKRETEKAYSLWPSRWYGHAIWNSVIKAWECDLKE